MARSGERAFLLLRTPRHARYASRHRFLHSAEPDIHSLSQAPQEASQKIELVFSASPETNYREPRECDLLRSARHLRDLAVCALVVLIYGAAASKLPRPCVLPQG
jgi:hypothetical protein